MNNEEYLNLIHLLLEQKKMLEILFPEKVSISYITQRTGKTRQAIRQFLINNYEEGVDFWLEKGKIFVAKKVALQLLK